MAVGPQCKLFRTLFLKIMEEAYTEDEMKWFKPISPTSNKSDKLA